MRHASGNETCLDIRISAAIIRTTRTTGSGTTTVRGGTVTIHIGTITTVARAIIITILHADAAVIPEARIIAIIITTTPTVREAAATVLQAVQDHLSTPAPRESKMLHMVRQQTPDHRRYLALQALQEETGSRVPL